MYVGRHIMCTHRLIGLSGHCESLISKHVSRYVTNCIASCDVLYLILEGKHNGHGGHNGQGKSKHSDQGKDHRQRQEVRQRSNQKDAKLVSCLPVETHGPCVTNKESGAPYCPEPGYECGKHNQCCPQVKGKPKGICVFTKEGGQRLCPRAKYACMGPNPSEKNRKMPMFLCFDALDLLITKYLGYVWILAQTNFMLERQIKLS
ncbi:hypothetical protein DdX_03668 [Ditylenchus destructor]|uniref:Uncharacterized protein n=1 Tax=Ditylenchus destructor TaxID=166010 RepID=A0AAD4NAR7_9BILA|nr:hypothetical protein DdX_03668 [Ditylenchus destructor]